MRMRQVALLMSASLLLAQASCGAKPDSVEFGKRVPCDKVTGQVYVDGEPAEGVRINAISTAPPNKTEKIDPGSKTGVTDKDGKVSFTTYRQDDGLPAGEYALVFIWDPGANMPRPSGRVDDKLNHLYDTVARSPRKIVVEKGKPLDFGRIDLTTKQ